jgi:hypothetical protein
MKTKQKGDFPPFLTTAKAMTTSGVVIYSIPTALPGLHLDHQDTEHTPEE